MATRIKGITVEINGSTTGLDKALKGTDSNISKVQSSLRDVNRLLKIDPKNTELLVQKQKLLAQAVEETKTKLDALKSASEQAAKTAGNYDEWKKAYTPVQEEIGNTQEKIKTLKEKMTELEKAGKVDTSEYKALGEELKNEQNHLDTLKQKAKEVDDEFGNPISPEKYDALQREIIETEQNLKSLQEEAKKASSVLGTQMQEAGQKMQKVGDNISSVGKKMMPATTAVAGIGIASIKTAADFESSMSQVAATMGMTSKEIEEGSEDYSKLEKAARDMGSATQYSASEAAEALNYLALAGYDVDRSVETLPTVLNLAAAGGIDLASASDMVTDAMSALGDTAGTAENFVDKMAKTSQKSNTSVAQLGEAILTVGGTAKTLAGGTTELNTALGILADNGIKGAEGGTALRNIILSLSAPTDTAAKKMKELGLEVLDANGNIRPMNDIFNDLNATLSTMSQGEQTQVLNEIFNKTDLKSVNALLANSGERFNELSAYLNDCDGAASTMADTMNNNLNGQLTQLKSALSEAAISIGQALLPMIKNAVSKIQEWTDKFNGLSDGQKRIILTIAAVVAAIGPILIIIGTLISSIGTITGAIGTFISFLGGISGASAVAGGGIALFSGSLLPVIGIIAGVTAAGVLLYKNWDTIKEKASELKEGIKNKWEEVKQSTKENWEETKESTKEAWDNMTEKIHTKLSEISEKTKSNIENVKSSAIEGWNNIQENTAQKWSEIQNCIDEHGGGIKGVIGTAMDGYKNIWRTGFSEIDNLTGGKLSNVLSTVTSRMSSVKNEFGSKIQGAKEKVNSGIENIKGIFNSLKLKLPEISIPKIKLPHFSISGGFSIKPPRVPSFSVEWYKDGGILSGAQIFGKMGNRLLGGGEAGKEAVLPLDSFYDRLEKIFKKSLNISIPDLSFMTERELAMNVNVYIGNKEFKDYIVKTAEKGISNKQQGNRAAKGWK